jgi:hypothetical protein
MVWVLWIGEEFPRLMYGGHWVDCSLKMRGPKRFRAVANHKIGRASQQRSSKLGKGVKPVLPRRCQMSTRLLAPLGVGRGDNRI